MTDIQPLLCPTPWTNSEIFTFEDRNEKRLSLGNSHKSNCYEIISAVACYSMDRPDTVERVLLRAISHKDISVAYKCLITTNNQKLSAEDKVTLGLYVSLISFHCSNQWRTEGGFGGGFKPPPLEIPKAQQNRAKFNPIVNTVKNCLI